MKWYLKQSWYFLLGLFGCFFLLELPIQWNYTIQNSDMGDWHILTGIDADVVFVGNSRTWTTFDTESMSARLGISVYTLAQDGWESHLLKTKLEHYLDQNTPPKLIFVQADPAILGQRTDWYDKPNFLKYIWLNREGLYSTMKNYEGSHWWEWSLPFVRYLGYPDTYIRDAAGHCDQLNRNKGSWPDTSTTVKPLPKLPITKWSNPEDGLDYLKQTSMIEGSQIYFYAPPISKTLSSISEFKPIQNKADSLNITFINLASQGLPDSCLRNHTHVNHFGSLWATDTLTAFILHIQSDALQQP